MDVEIKKEVVVEKPVEKTVEKPVARPVERSVAESKPEVKIENILVKFAETGVFDINVLTDFLVYWAQQISVGVNIFEEPTQIGEDSIGGSQFVKEQQTLKGV